MQSFAKHVREKLDSHREWDVTLHSFHFGNRSDETTINNIMNKNHGKKFTQVAQLKSLDRVLHLQTMSVMSVKIQGDEDVVLKGAEKLLTAGHM